MVVQKYLRSVHLFFFLHRSHFPGMWKFSSFLKMLVVAHSVLSCFTFRGLPGAGSLPTMPVAARAGTGMLEARSSPGPGPKTSTWAMSVPIKGLNPLNHNVCFYFWAFIGNWPCELGSNWLEKHLKMLIERWMKHSKATGSYREKGRAIAGLLGVRADLGQ